MYYVVHAILNIAIVICILHSAYCIVYRYCILLHIVYCILLHSVYIYCILHNPYSYIILCSMQYSILNIADCYSHPGRQWQINKSQFQNMHISIFINDKNVFCTFQITTFLLCVPSAARWGQKFQKCIFSIASLHVTRFARIRFSRGMIRALLIIIYYIM